MSQEKVNRYKEEKANRKKNMQKEKTRRTWRYAAAGVIVLVLVGWIGYSAYNMYESNQPQQTAEVDYSAITDYQQSLNVTE